MEFVRLINGPEAFTPDNEFILGPTDVRGFWVAAGLLRARPRRRRRHGPARRGVDRRRRAEPRRLGDGLAPLRHGATAPASTRSRARSRSTRRTTTSSTRATSARPGGRCAPRRPTPRLQELGAAFGEKSGWERPNWFEPNAAAGDESLRPRGWAGRLWSPAVGAEHRATREAAALFDETSFAKIEVSGEGAADFLERLCDNRVARDVGAITYTSDAERARRDRVRLHRHAPRRRPLPHRHRHRLRPARPRRGSAQHAPEDGSVVVEDVTSRYACLGIWGPTAREILQPLTTADLSNDAFPYMRAREIAVGAVPCLALRVTYVGELGWELYCPIEFGLAPLGRDLGGRPRRTGSSPAATRRSTRAGSRRATASGAPTSRPTTRPFEAGPRVRGQARQGRLHRPRRAARARRSPSAGSPASSSTTRAPSRSARSRSGSTARPSAGSRAAATATRSSARSRTPTCRPTTPSRARRSRSRSSATGSQARSRPSRCTTRPVRGIRA